MSTNIEILPGKSNNSFWLPAWMHMEDTAMIAEKLVRHWLPMHTYNFIESEIASGNSKFSLIQYAKLLGYLHDIGKFTYGFQTNILLSNTELKDKVGRYFFFSESRERAPFSHSLASQNILLKYGLPKPIAVVAGAHHGKTHDDLRFYDLQVNRGLYFGSEEEKWTNVWKQWINYALEKCGIQSIKEIPVVSQPSQMILSGLLLDADWITSNEEYFPLTDIDTVPKFGNYSSKRPDAAWNKFDVPSPWNLSNQFSIDDETFKERFSGYEPNEVQKEMITCANTNNGHGGLYILEAPMGCGKTEAALIAAEILAAKNECGGVFFGLPTRATANGIFDRILPWAKGLPEEERKSIKLAHQTADLNENYTKLKEGNDESLFVHEWLSGKKQTMQSDFVIGTVDQLLLAGLNRKHAMMRHLGLAGKVVIVDEVHAYDPYMSAYLDTVLRWLGSYKTPVILLSATLPRERRSELVKAYLNRAKITKQDEGWETTEAYPVLTCCAADGNTASVRSIQIDYADYEKKVKIDKIDDEQILEYINKSAETGCIGIICNTVKRAQRIAKYLSEELNDTAEIIEYHSYFTDNHRAEIEEKIIETVGKKSVYQKRYDKKHIIVGTQTLEQSLDLDFDLMITDMCPMDVFFQRIGRLFRHKRERGPQFSEARCAVLSIKPEFFRVYEDKWTLLQTEKLLPAELSLPSDISSFVQSAYDTSGDLNADKELQNHFYIKNELSRRAFSHTIPAPKRRIDATIENTLTCSINTDEDAEAASVRCGIQRISVHVMVYSKEDDRIHFLFDKHNSLSRSSAPSYEEVLKIKKQRINLPIELSVGQTANDIISKLESENAAVIPEWQNAPDLKGALILLLDEDFKVRFKNYSLLYHKTHGLETTKNDYER